jgi:hypothetical protein
MAQCLARSERAANTFPAFLHTIFDALFSMSVLHRRLQTAPIARCGPNALAACDDNHQGPNTSDKLRQAGVMFTNFVFRTVCVSLDLAQAAPN